MTANEYTAGKMGGYDWRGRTDEAMRYADEFNQSLVPQTQTGTGGEGSGISWSSDNPNQLMYGGNVLGGEMYNDPEVVRMLQQGAAAGSAASPYMQQALGNVSPETIQGIEGSSHSVAPEVLNKMWRPGK